MSDEVWLPVVGYEMHYEVSSLGRVRRILSGRGATAGRVLALALQGDYLAVTLYMHDERRKQSVHVLVATAFHGQRPEGMVPNHKDASKLNNRADNLEWVTAAENVRHAIANGLVGGRPLPGALNGRAKLSADQVEAIRSDSRTQRVIATAYGISKSQVGNIKRGDEWPEDLRIRQFPEVA